MTDDDPVMWMFLVERGLEAGSDLRLFWREAEAIEAARGHLSGSWPIEGLVTQDRVYEMIEAINQVPGSDEYLVLAPISVKGDG